LKRYMLPEEIEVAAREIQERPQPLRSAGSSGSGAAREETEMREDRRIDEKVTGE